MANSDPRWLSSPGRNIWPSDWGTYKPRRTPSYTMKAKKKNYYSITGFVASRSFLHFIFVLNVSFFLAPFCFFRLLHQRVALWHYQSQSRCRAGPSKWWPVAFGPSLCEPGHCQASARRERQRWRSHFRVTDVGQGIFLGRAKTWTTAVLICLIFPVGSRYLAGDTQEKDRDEFDNKGY